MQRAFILHTTSFRLVPSAALLVLAESGVSGSISPVRMLLSSGCFPPLIQSAFSLQGSGGLVYC